MSEKAHFSAEKIFVALFVLTALEVGWSFLPLGVFAIRLGLIVFAVWKGYLIFTYFMHMKYEGWVVKGLIAPTIPLVAIVIFATMPDVSMNSKLKYPIGYMKLENGQVVDQEHAADARGIGQKEGVSAERGAGAPGH
jgi:cytochrome c oxidase subunit 4